MTGPPSPAQILRATLTYVDLATAKLQCLQNALGSPHSAANAEALAMAGQLAECLQRLAGTASGLQQLARAMERS